MRLSTELYGSQQYPLELLLQPLDSLPNSVEFILDGSHAAGVYAVFFENGNPYPFVEIAQHHPVHLTAPDTPEALAALSQQADLDVTWVSPEEFAEQRKHATVADTGKGDIALRDFETLALEKDPQGSERQNRHYRGEYAYLRRSPVFRDYHVEKILTDTDTAARLGSVASRRAWVQSLSFEEFHAWITDINAAYRGLPTEMHTLDAPAGVRLSHDRGTSAYTVTYTPPPVETHAFHLRSTLYTAQKIADNSQLSDDDAMLRIADTVAGGIILTHPFKDGNGRTSRAMSFLLEQGCDGSPESVAEFKDAVSSRKQWDTTIDVHDKLRGEIINELLKDAPEPPPAWAEVIDRRSLESVRGSLQHEPLAGALLYRASRNLPDLPETPDEENLVGHTVHALGSEGMARLLQRVNTLRGEILRRFLDGMKHETPLRAPDTNGMSIPEFVRTQGATASEAPRQTYSFSELAPGMAFHDPLTEPPEGAKETASTQHNKAHTPPFEVREAGQRRRSQRAL